MRSPNLQQRLYLARAMNEQLEGIFDHDRQLNELSKKTYRNYIKKASRDAVNKTIDSSEPWGRRSVSDRYVQNARRKADNRLRGIERATDAMSEDVEGIFDHDRQLAEGSYVHSKGELKKAVKGSKKEIGKAYKKGDKKAMKSWLENKKDAEEQLGNIKEEEELDEEWGGGFQSSADAHREVQNSLRADAKRQQNRTLDLLVKVHRGEISKRKFNKVHGGGFTFDELMKSRFYANKIKRMPKYKLAPVEKPAAAPKTKKKPVMEAGEAELGRARKAEAQARKYAVQRTGTTVDGKVVKAAQRVHKLRLKKLTKERLKTGLNPRIDDSRADRMYPHQAIGSMGPITKGYRATHVIPKKVLAYRAASQAKKQAALRSKGLA